MAKIKIPGSNEERTIVRTFSESFKRKKVEELERNLASVTDISRQYGVTRTAIYKWIEKYSVMKKKAIRQIVEPLSDTRKIEALQKQIADLERSVGQKQIIIDFQATMIELAEEHFKVDIKKNFGSRHLPSWPNADRSKEQE